MKQLTRRLLPLLACLCLALAFLAPAMPTAAQTGSATNADWPYYGNDVGSMRYANLDQINPSNVSQLKPVWIFHTNVMSKDTSFESQPIVVGGTMYVTSPHSHVFALDAVTGALKWTYSPQMPTLHDMAICCGQTNRGVAVGDGKVFVGQLDGNLTALDANTGQIAWKVQVVDWHQRWTETMAPQYYDGKVFIGASGGEFDVRGSLTAYDANTGKQLWRFWTIPGPGEPGHDTWTGTSWQAGGAPVWSTPAIDPQLGLVYLSTGNAGNDLNGSTRAGQNLYSASVVAVDLNTGQYRWHFQEVHHDIWDYDGPEPPLLFTLDRNGQQIPALGHANKDGFYFILDRRTGRPLYPVKEVPVPQSPSWQNPWPTQPEPSIDPLIPHSVTNAQGPFTAVPFWTPPQATPHLLQPGAESGPEWPPAAYSPRTHYIYVPAGGYEPWLYYASQNSPNALGSTLADKPSYPAQDHYGLFDALDSTTGKMAWQMKVPQRAATGVTVAGDLVFLGEGNGKFHAVDAKSGQVLWTWQSSDPGFGGANGAPAVYMINGREYVAMAFGGNTQVRSGQTSPPGDALAVFALPQAGQGAPSVVTAHPTPIPDGEVPDSNKQPIAHSAPSGAMVVKIDTHDLFFYPNHFSAPPGAQIAIHLVNVEPGDNEHNFFIALPDGWHGMNDKIKPGEDGYFTFTAPSASGTYTFWCDVGTHRFHGMVGTMTVDPSLAAPVLGPDTTQPIGLPTNGQMGGGVVVIPLNLTTAGLNGGIAATPAPTSPSGSAPGMPRTGNGDGSGALWALGLLAAIALAAGLIATALGRRRLGTRR